MLTLILFLVVGGAITYVAQFNLQPVTLSVGPYSFANIPLFYVIIGSLLIGLCLGYIMYLIHSLATGFSLHAKDKVIHEAKNDIAELTKTIHQLELENQNLKKKNPRLKMDNSSL